VAAAEAKLANIERERIRRKPLESLNALECYQHGHLQSGECETALERATMINAKFALVNHIRDL